MPSGAPCEALPERCYSLAADEVVLCNDHVANFKSISAVCKLGGRRRDVGVQMDLRQILPWLGDKRRIRAGHRRVPLPLGPAA